MADEENDSWRTVQPHSPVAVTECRFFTVYGSYGRPDLAYFSFANNIVRGRPITIFQGEGGKELARDFTHVSDVVAGVVAALETSEPSEKRPDGGKPANRVFNLGNKHPVTVSDFVSVLEKHLGKTAIREYVPMPKTGDVPFTHARVARAALTSWDTSRARRWTRVYARSPSGTSTFAREARARRFRRTSRAEGDGR